MSVYKEDIHAIMTAIIYAAGGPDETISGAIVQARAINAQIAKLKKDEQAIQKVVPTFCGPDAGKPRMTPMELTIQSLMAPDKNGNVGRPIRSVAMETFSHIENRTLDALWKFAEGVASSCGGCPTVDAVQDLTARAESAEGCLAEEYDKRKAAEAKLQAYEDQNRGSVEQWQKMEGRIQSGIKEESFWRENAAALRVELNILQESYDMLEKRASHVVYMHDTGMLENTSGESQAIVRLRECINPTEGAK